MPKELVRSHQVYSKPVTSEDTTPYVGLGVHVGWESDSVQLYGVLVYADHTSRDGGPSVPLDRHGLNELIRTLRKARDRAFGTDA